MLSYPPDLSQDEVDFNLASALQVWADNSGLRFTRSYNETPVLKISWEPKSHGDEHVFDGPDGVLAHAFFPKKGGFVHFDLEELWTVGVDHGKASSYTTLSNRSCIFLTISMFLGYNVFQVAAHEFGHALGLKHSQEPDALMYPYYRGYTPIFDYLLPQDDIQGEA